MVENRHRTTRRVLLRVGALAAAASTAGCTVEIGGYEIGIGDAGDGGTSTPTSTFGYGGSPTPTRRPPDTSTPDDDPATRTPPPDDTSKSADEYGLQGYGEYGYGGVAP